MNAHNECSLDKDIIEFVKKSTPTQNNLKLCKGSEDAGWVSLYFKYDESDFEVFVTLAANDLSDLVIFFENIINLKEKSATYLDNEMISLPLLYASPINNQKIRFLIADCERAHDLSKEGKIKDDYWNLCYYDIKCDVIVEKKKLLKEFYRAIKNIINSFEEYPERIYDINYIHWKDEFKNIVRYIKN